MAAQCLLLFCLLLLLGFLASTTDAAKPSPYSESFNRNSFPTGFIFGAGSAAYQSEGAAFEDGKGKSIWDTFVRKYPEKIADKSNGDAADDFYHRYKEDIKLMKTIGDDYLEYVDFCFKTFGDRVKLWVTMNEPNGFVVDGYNGGSFAPGRCSNYVGTCPAGDSATEPYIATHHLLLCHAAAVKLYRKKYKPFQKGEIGITIVTNWYIAKFNTTSSHRAASRAMDFLFGWFVNPITFGEYPKSMQSIVGRRLPKFTEAQSKMLKGSFDFLAVNYYTTNYADNDLSFNGFNLSYTADRQANLTTEKNGVPDWHINFFELAVHSSKGIARVFAVYKGALQQSRMADNASLPLKDALNDKLRIAYHHGHLIHLLKSIKDGVRVKGYYIWSFFDDFEWDAGYTVRFGITYVDYKNNLRRHLKSSAYWFKKFLLN
ncbi:hypothetical protein Patl1_17271 [Pistacia atlantica]|uniref:Uncharacterized protein n=1 Tax=Pistacia atlantica TaxID=434234 RepID=A0ACC1BBA8_9ROSI|nr:hypothetical protein Patl1_17271 [Pistacia atlantica]